MSVYRIASRYAKALLTLSDEQGVLEKVNQDLLLFSEICKTNHDFVLMLKNPIITHDKKLSILESIFVNKVNELTLAFFRIITRKYREAYLPAITQEFHNLYNVKKQIQTAQITTTSALDEELRSEFKKLIQKTFGKEIELKEKIDKDLIGGFILQLEDRQIDNSLSTRLRELKMKFSEKLYQKNR